MQIQVMMPSPAVDFNFDSTSTSPFVSAPSSPQRFGNFFYSAPTSPSRASSFHNEFSINSTGDNNPSSTIPFNWEETPGVPKRKEPENENDEYAEDDDATIFTDDDFEFEFSGQLDRPSLTADELFDGGKIKPLKPPPRLFYTDGRVGDSPRSSPRSPKRMLREALSFKEALSPRHRKKDFDPFSEAIRETRRRDHSEIPQRGRERTHNPSNSIPRHKATRSLSPYRVSDMLFDGYNNQQNSRESTSTWLKLKDLLLFRSASEGNGTTSKDPLKKYAMLKKQSSDDVKNSSFRSTDSSGSVGSTSRRRRRVSAHELHYTANRAVTEEMRRKTFLPYKRGLLGCLGFHHVQGVHEISRGFGSVLRRE